MIEPEYRNDFEEWKELTGKSSFRLNYSFIFRLCNIVVIFCKNRSLPASCIDLICEIVIFILYTAVLEFFCLVALKQVIMYCKKS